MWVFVLFGVGKTCSFSFLLYIKHLLCFISFFYSVSVFLNISLSHLFPFLSCSFYFPVSLCICMSFASGWSLHQHGPVVWFYYSSTSMHWPAGLQPAPHQLKRWSDCPFFCISHLMNDAKSHHAQFQCYSDLLSAFGQTLTAKQECFIGKPETVGCKNYLAWYLLKRGKLVFCLYCLKYWEHLIQACDRTCSWRLNTCSFS